MQLFIVHRKKFRIISKLYLQAENGFVMNFQWNQTVSEIKFEFIFSGVILSSRFYGATVVEDSNLKTVCSRVFLFIKFSLLVINCAQSTVIHKKTQSFIIY